MPNEFFMCIIAFIAGMCVEWLLDQTKAEYIPPSDPPVVVSVRKEKPVRIAFQIMEDPQFFSRNRMDEEEIDKYIRYKGLALMRESLMDFVQYRITERVDCLQITGCVTVMKGEEL